MKMFFYLPTHFNWKNASSKPFWETPSLPLNKKRTVPSFPRDRFVGKEKACAHRSRLLMYRIRALEGFWMKQL
jgi:hypothetical protein